MILEGLTEQGAVVPVQVTDQGRLVAEGVTAPNASTTERGIVELATPAEIEAGTDDERVITPAGLKGRLNATTVWKRSGSTLSPAVAGDVVSISAGTAALPSLTPAGDTNTGIYSPGPDQVACATGGIGRLFVGASGLVGVGNSSPEYQLDVTCGVNGVRFAFDAYSRLEFNIANNGTETVVKSSITAPRTPINLALDAGQASGSIGGALIFRSGGSVERMRIAGTGQVLIGTATANTSGAKLQTSDGLTFPAAQVASSNPNTLDDYEEGTWTPTIVGATVAGEGTYSIQDGRYVKIGRMVYIQARMEWSAHTGTGAMRIGGLPFAVSSNASTPAIPVVPSGMTSTANTLPQAYAQLGSSYLVLVATAIAGGTETFVLMDTSAGIRTSGWYET